MSFADHFSAASRQYAAHRPSYPPAFIAHVASLAPGRDLAWDCATGNGQAALGLVDHFQRIIATDASAEQLARAEPHPRIEYRNCLEDESGLDAASVDLVAVAQALHWLDTGRFFAEAERVLKPHGVVAAWCYGLFSVSPEVDRILRWFYVERIGGYWPPERQRLEVGYRTIALPFDAIAADPWPMTSPLDRIATMAYVGTWSAVIRARAQEGVDPVQELDAALAPLWPERETRLVTWPLTLRAGRKCDA